MFERLKDMFGELNKTKLKFKNEKISCSNEEIEVVNKLFKSIEIFVDYIDKYVTYINFNFNQFDPGHPLRNLASAIYRFDESKTQVAAPGSAFSGLLKFFEGELRKEIKNMENILKEFIKMHNDLERNKKDIASLSGQRSTKLQEFLADILKYGRLDIEKCNKHIKEAKDLLANN